MLILSMEDDPRYVREAFAAGARGYLLKEAVANEVVGAIREVAAGGRYVHPELGARLIDTEPPAAEPRTTRSPSASARCCAARARPHEPRDRQAALHLGPDGRGAPRAHHEEARPREPRRARPLRDRTTDSRRRLSAARRAERDALSPREPELRPGESAVSPGLPCCFFLGCCRRTLRLRVRRWLRHRRTLRSAFSNAARYRRL